MRKIIFVWALPLMLAIFAILNVAVFAGDLEPTDPPGSTMKTLDQVEPRTPISALPYTITSSGSYYVTADLSSSGNGIIVNASHVTIDLFGFSLVGPGSGTNYGIYMNGRTNVEVRNGTIRNFKYGIWENSTSDGKKHRIISIRAIGNQTHGIWLNGSNGSAYIVKECTLADNGYRGLWAGGDGSLILNNIAMNNGDFGIAVERASTLIGNIAYGNGSDGINSYYGCTVRNNTSYDNGGNGINTGPNSTVISNSVITNAGDGIKALNSLVLNNQAQANTGWGLNIPGSGGYGNNVIIANNGGFGHLQVNGGIQVSTNICDDNTTCP